VKRLGQLLWANTRKNANDGNLDDRPINSKEAVERDRNEEQATPLQNRINPGQIIHSSSASLKNAGR
jgi:hypothetical protein